jgi:hypothetical protein
MILSIVTRFESATLFGMDRNEKYFDQLLHVPGEVNCGQDGTFSKFIFSSKDENI